MEKYSYAEKIVEKVRSILVLEPYKHCVSTLPEVVITGDTFELQEIIFDDGYMRIVVDNKGIGYRTGTFKTHSEYFITVEYNGFDELLNL